MKGAPRKQNGDGNATKHGLYTMKKALMRLGNRAIDRRTKPGRALTKWRVDLVRDLGGDASIQQDTIIDLAVKSKLIIDSVDAWLFAQPSLVNARKKALLPVVIQRQQLADSLARYLIQLGLERRTKVQTLAEMLEEEAGDGD